MAKRRGNGEGSIYQRSDGRWVGSVSLADGMRKGIYGKTRQDAAARLLTVLKARTDNLPIPAERNTVGAFLADWLEDTAPPRVRASTFVGYEVVVRVHLVPQLGRLRLARLAPADVARAMPLWGRPVSLRARYGSATPCFTRR